MTENTEIEKLSNEIGEKTRFSPTIDSIKEFENRLEKVDIKEFIIYVFINNSGTWLRELILSTSKYWKDLSYNDWNYIFGELSRNDLAKYYMKFISTTYLGIEPIFINKKSFLEKISKTRNTQRKKSSFFIGNLNTESPEYEILESQNYVSLEELIKISNKLENEMILEN
jgi:hypothetical protein